jgi:alpha-ketoglutarate-dependent taurine dioxygenase
LRAVTTISVKPLSPHIGAEIGDVDLTKPLSAEQVSDIRDALARHGVIFFREQPLDLEMHRRFALCYG